jgi:hypothetical protein
VAHGSEKLPIQKEQSVNVSRDLTFYQQLVTPSGCPDACADQLVNRGYSAGDAIAGPRVSRRLYYTSGVALSEKFLSCSDVTAIERQRLRDR